MVALNIKEGMAGRWFRLVLSTITNIGPMLIYLVGGILMMEYDHNLTVGDITVLVSLLGRMYAPVNSLMNFGVDWIRSMSLFKRIFDYFDMEVEIKNSEHPIVLDKVEGSVEFKHVNFHYNEDRQILKDVNFELTPGKSIAIVGPSGSGKSTIINLIPRIYDVISGQVLFDGVDVRDLDLAFLRRQIGIVSQETYLFNGTIKDNLLYANENASDEEIIEACKLADAHEFVSSFEDGYDTFIEQGGTNVSGGQKQRLCIARALLKKPKILILDDSTSAVDTKTDAKIRAAFKSYIPDTTKIIIAQRISSVQDSDMIIVMDNGHISDVGTHDELLKKSEIYREVYVQQTEGGKDNE